MGSKNSKSKKRKKSECHCNNHFCKEECKIQINFSRCRDDNHLCLNVSGLTDNLNFQLLRFKDCEVEIETILGSTGNKVRGKVRDVGIDFIEIEEEKGKIVTILKDKVSQIHWIDEKCKSCCD